MRAGRVAIAAMAMMAGAATAQAATVTRSFTVNASNFASNTGVAVPVDPVVARFTITLDTQADVAPTLIGDFTSNLPASYGQGVRYAYSATSDILTVGQDASVNSVGYPQGGIGLIIDNASGQPTSSTFVYISDTNGAVAYESTDIRVSVAGVPEPLTWAMMVAGLGAIGGALRVRRRHATVTRALMPS